ncbi:MAG: DUF4115 domain-containing protein [Acidobacteriota bacterium]|nr:MAG: DUF4115 domain-containing protein [Acidobacteriota bacterium]
MASLGQELKKARENRGITLHEIADATNIGVRFLQAIENDTYDILPGGVFNRAFVKKFANIVNYDEAQALQLYDEQVGETGNDTVRRSYSPIEDLDARAGSGNGLLISLLALIILTAGAYLAYEYFKTPAPEAPPPEQINNSLPGAVTEPTATPDAAASEAVAPGELKVRLIANTEQCWLSWRLDNEKPEQVTLNPGDFREFTVNDKLLLIIGNMPAVSVRINGKLANPDKLAPNRKSVVAENVVITKENYQQFIE